MMNRLVISTIYGIGIPPVNKLVETVLSKKELWGEDIRL
jgi:hypothetical protein